MTTNDNRAFVAEIWTEGKTDWKILKKALEVLELQLLLRFHESDQDMGDQTLLDRLYAFSQRPNPEPIIFIFDHDNPTIIDKVDSPEKKYKSWGNNVFSFSLPIPSHREGYETVSIEFYFTDDELLRLDRSHRRLFLSSEFNEKSGKHITEIKINYAYPNKLRGMSNTNRMKIIDSYVFDENSNNIALSKSDFAYLVDQSTAPFNDLNFQSFTLIFDLIQQIIDTTKPKHNIYLPDLPSVFNDLEVQEPANQYSRVLSLFIDAIRLALYIFSVSTIRIYEDQIINETPKNRTKIIPIKRIISENFFQPSLTNLNLLAQKCFHLIDVNAPVELTEMKENLGQTILLEEIGQLLDDLDLIFPKEHGERRARVKLHRDILNKLIPMFAQILDANKDGFQANLGRVTEYSESIHLHTWKVALEKMIQHLSPIFSYPIIFRSIKSYDPFQENYVLEVKSYENNEISISEEILPKDNADIDIRASELLLDKNKSIHLYPMLLVRKDALFMYTRTRQAGYEFYSPALNEFHVEKTKRNFVHSIFKLSSKQDYFWIDVPPVTNPENGIRANIPSPSDDSVGFVGRRKIINSIKDDIIEIANENAIIYGLGGIGKTALINQLSRELFAEKAREKILFDNIIWVSSKRDRYEYVTDTIEKQDPKIRTLDDILLTIMNFFEFELEELEGYDLDAKKELTLEILRDKKNLLIIDNFETLTNVEQQKILTFFGTTVKRYLRDKPNNFKIILTSRELVASNFHQVELKGLDEIDTIKLINKFSERYKLSQQFTLTDEQKKQLHKVTTGIPILVKHCLARIYEHNESYDAIINSLPSASSKLVEFSFKEILEKIKLEDDQVGLMILLLFEIVDGPLMTRQITDILEVSEELVLKRLPELSNFECVKRLTLDNREKYTLNDEIRLLTKALIRDHHELYRAIRRKFYRNYSLDRQMDFTVEEENIINIFEGYLKDGLTVEAEDYIRRELSRKKDSVLMNYYYAKYLKGRRKVDAAIGILENIREISRNHPSVLKLLFSCYANLDIPNYDKAEDLMGQIKASLGDEIDLGLTIEMVKFLTHWAATLKSKKGLDHFEDSQRISHYKELSDRALAMLEPLESDLYSPITESNISLANRAEIFYLLSQCHYNRWEYDIALRYINKAISISTDYSYEKFRKLIQKSKVFYNNNPWADVKS